MKSNICCILNPTYTCSSCKYKQCLKCNDRRINRKNQWCHFIEKKNKNGRRITCSVTGQVVYCREVAKLNDEGETTFVWLPEK